MCVAGGCGWLYVIMIQSNNMLCSTCFDGYRCEFIIRAYTFLNSWLVVLYKISLNKSNYCC